VSKIAFSSTGSMYGEAMLVPTPADAPFAVQTSLYGLLVIFVPKVPIWKRLISNSCAAMCAATCWYYKRVSFFIAMRARRSIAAGVDGDAAGRCAVHPEGASDIGAGAAGCEHAENLGPFE
jgi:hypothetical protein